MPKMRRGMPTANTETPVPVDVLARIQKYVHREEGSLHKPITPERAAEIADALLPFDDDAMVYLFLELMHGMMATVYRKDHKTPCIDSLVLYATIAAYKHTHHFEASLEEFALLDWNNERDKRVIFGKIADETEDESES